MQAIQTTSIFPKKALALLVTSGMLLGVSGCGGGDGNHQDNQAKIESQSPVKEGLLLSPPQNIASFTGQELVQKLQKIDPIATTSVGEVKCDVKVQKISYKTKDVHGEPIVTSAALMLPSGDKAECQGERPLVLYAHGTAIEKSYDFTQVGNANNEAGKNATMVAQQFAGQGYVVIAPNYVGYDNSSADYHPYVNAKQQSLEMADTLAAGREALKKGQSHYHVKDNGKLFITGYSEGGYVALATARYLQYSGEHVTAVAPLSGPYAMLAFGDVIFSGKVNVGASVFAPLLAKGYQQAYGNIYKDAKEVYNPKYVATAEQDLPSQMSFEALVKKGKLPVSALFQAAPTGTANLDAISPESPTFSYGFAKEDYLINTPYRADYLLDAQDNPDGLTRLLSGETVFPAPAETPANNLRKALKINDLRGYNPKMPVFMCGGNQDPTVFFDVNTNLMGQIWGTVAKSPELSFLDVIVLDVDISNASERETYQNLSYIGQAKYRQDSFDPIAKKAQMTFANTMQQLAQTAGKTAMKQVLENGGDEQTAMVKAEQTGKFAVATKYHGTLTAPVCVKATKAYFDSF